MRDLKDVYQRVATRNAEGRRNKIVKMRRKDGQRGQSKLRSVIIYLEEYVTLDRQHEKDVTRAIHILADLRNRILEKECGATLTLEEEVIKALDGK